MYTYVPQIRRVIDGDTFIADIDLGFGIWIHGKSIRIAHIDAPERNTDEGKAAKAFIETLFSGANIFVVVLDHKGDKYGRLLAEVSVNGKPLHQVMIEHGHAKSYEGGKKI